MSSVHDTPSYHFVGSCGKCGIDYAFGSSKERNDWFRSHAPDHYDFVSFFKQVRL